MKKTTAITGLTPLFNIKRILLLSSCLNRLFVCVIWSATIITLHADTLGKAVTVASSSPVKVDDKEQVKIELTRIADLSPAAVAASAEEMSKRADRTIVEKAQDTVGSAERKLLKEQYQARLAEAKNDAERESLLIEYQIIQRGLAAEAELRKISATK